jgi:uncharacterized protein DUF955
MTKWQAAHRIAQIAAQNARGEAGLEHDQRVDIIAMIDAAGVEVFGQHSSRLFGATIPAEGDRPLAIWLNANSTVNGQRHTAAHEWGHRVLNHTATCELEVASFTDVDAAGRSATADPQRNAARTLPEVTAEAFAAWLLMPRTALRAALRAVDHSGAVTPTACYLISLLLGTSYAGTARHLATAHIIERPTSAALARVAPGRVKKDLDVAGAPPRDPRADVWPLAAVCSYGHLVFAEGDRIVVPTASPAATLGERLVEHGLAATVWESFEHRVLVARALEDDDRNGVLVDHGGREVQVRVDRVLRGMSDSSGIPDLSTMSEDEIDAMQQAQEQIFREVRGGS